MLSLSGYALIFNFVLAPLVIIFALSSAIPRWLSKKEKWQRDFQYLIHGVFIMKITMITTNLAHTIISIEEIIHFEQYVNAEKVMVFAFDSAVLLTLWYTVLFNKSVSSSSFIGAKRLSYHILAILTTVAIGLADAFMHNCESRVYIEFSDREYEARDEGDRSEDFYHDVIRYSLIFVGAFVLIWTRYKLYSSNSGGVIYQTLKAYFKRCDWLIAIVLVDLSMAALFDICCKLGGMTVEHSNAWRDLYFFILLLQIYILVALIKIRHVYHICNEQHTPQKQSEQARLLSGNLERVSPNRGSSVSHSSYNPANRSKIINFFNNLLQPQNILFITER